VAERLQRSQWATLLMDLLSGFSNAGERVNRIGPDDPVGPPRNQHGGGDDGMGVQSL